MAYQFTMCWPCGHFVSLMLGTSLSLLVAAGHVTLSICMQPVQLLRLYATCTTIATVMQPAQPEHIHPSYTRLATTVT